MMEEVLEELEAFDVCFRINILVRARDAQEAYDVALEALYVKDGLYWECDLLAINGE